MQHRWTQNNETQEPTTSLWTTMTRLIGFGVVLFGLVTLYFVIQTAWGLFHDQQLVQRMGQQIEENSGLGAHLDDKLRTIAEASVLMANRTDSTPEPAGQLTSPTAPESKQASPRDKTPYAYVMAWAITIVLLGLLARVGLSALSHGAKIAAFQEGVSDQTKKAVQELALELKGVRNRAVG